jgi:hypothetical protein
MFGSTTIPRDECRGQAGYQCQWRHCGFQFLNSWEIINPCTPPSIIPMPTR